MSSFCDTYVDRGHAHLSTIERVMINNRLLAAPENTDVNVRALYVRTASACRALGKFRQETGSIAEQWAKQCANLYRAIVAKEPSLDDTNHLARAVDTLDATVVAINRNQCLKLVGARPTLMSF